MMPRFPWSRLSALRGALFALAPLLLLAPGARALEPGEFDPARFDALLMKYVADGRVDYAAWKSGGVAELDAFLDSLAVYDLGSVMGKEPRASFLLNAYNAWVVRQVLDHYPVKSVKDIPGFFDKNTRKIAGEERTLDGIETALAELLPHRPEFALALCTGAIGGPALLETAYRSDIFEPMIAKTLRGTFQRKRIRYDPAANEVHCPPEVDRYMDRYKALPQGILSAFSSHLTLSEIIALNTKQPKFVVDPVDWSLNEIPPHRTDPNGVKAP
jgi:hypothetical protein